jgi:hypothetical protein
MSSPVRGKCSCTRKADAPIDTKLQLGFSDSAVGAHFRADINPEYTTFTAATWASTRPFHWHDNAICTLSVLRIQLAPGRIHSVVDRGMRHP